VRLEVMCDGTRAAREFPLVVAATFPARDP
jgi:hypothetical protein